MSSDGVLHQSGGHTPVCHYGQTPVGPHQLFEARLDTIERAIRRVCRDARLSGADAEDFASAVKLALLAGDGEILRKWEGRSSFATYLTIVIRRLLIDQRRTEGRWYVSAEARRRGEHAVLLDQLLHRDRNSFDEAAAIVATHHPGVATTELREIAAVLPERAARPRVLPMIEEDEQRFAGDQTADARVLEREAERRSAEVSRVLAGALAALPAQDRLVLRLRFAKGASIADIARALGVEQRPLYRRVEALLAGLRRALAQAGFDAASVTDLIGGAAAVFDFGLQPSGENAGETP